ncbi:MAG: CcdB family protein [Phenylobacterium sp.]
MANPSAQSRETAPYFVILQSHHVRGLDSLVVAPLVRDASRLMSDLDLEVEVEGERLVIVLGELFSIERVLLKKGRHSVADHEDAIRRALDRVFTGF